MIVLKVRSLLCSVYEKLAFWKQTNQDSCSSKVFCFSFLFCEVALPASIHKEKETSLALNSLWRLNKNWQHFYWLVSFGKALWESELCEFAFVLLPLCNLFSEAWNDFCHERRCSVIIKILEPSLIKSCVFTHHYYDCSIQWKLICTARALTFYLIERRNKHQ